MSASRSLWLLAILLAAGVAAEAFAPGKPKPFAPRAGAASQPVSSIAASDPVAAFAAAILQRPLFSASRRPPAAAAAAQAGPGGQALPRLAGIIVSPDSRRAIFAGDGDHSTVASEGANVGVWRVTSIGAEAVTLAGPEGSRTVRPSYSAAPAPAVPAPPLGFNPGGVAVSAAAFPGAFPLALAPPSPQNAANPPPPFPQPGTDPSGRPASAPPRNH